MQGRLIVIDGLDGSGKTTQFEKMLCRLEAENYSVKGISFPDYQNSSAALVKMYLKGDFGDSPDSVNAYAASSFYAVDRFASYKQLWEKDYLFGTWILASRYTTSNAIHQMSKLPQPQWDGYLQWLSDYEYTKLGLPKPDKVLFLDVLPQVSQKMLEQRYLGDETRKDIHERDVEYLARCRKAALYAAQRENWKIVTCSSEDKMYDIETIHQQIYNAITKEL